MLIRRDRVVDEHASDDAARVQRHVHGLRVRLDGLARRHAPPVHDDVLDVAHALLGELVQGLRRESVLDILGLRRLVGPAEVKKSKWWTEASYR